jgi:hypothetical protein
MNAGQHVDSNRVRNVVERRHTKSARTVFWSETFVENPLTVRQKNYDRMIEGASTGVQKRTGLYGIACGNRRSFAVHPPCAPDSPRETGKRPTVLFCEKRGRKD